MSTIEEVLTKIINFRDDREWKQFHNPKDLAISLSLEASELLENFQWKSSEESIEKNLSKIEDELADVLIYSFLFADAIGVDALKIIENKLMKNNEKYPVEKAIGSNKKYTEL